MYLDFPDLTCRQRMQGESGHSTRIVLTLLLRETRVRSRLYLIHACRASVMQVGESDMSDEAEEEGCSTPQATRGEQHESSHNGDAVPASGCSNQETQEEAEVGIPGCLV